MRQGVRDLIAQAAEDGFRESADKAEPELRLPDDVPGDGLQAACMDN
jgi:hypothetical protein